MWTIRALARGRDAALAASTVAVRLQRSMIPWHGMPEPKLAERRLVHRSTVHGAAFWTKLASMIGVGPESKSSLRTRGFLLYQSTTEAVDYASFFEGMEMADTFHSWFRITELHVWMLMVRLMAEGPVGRGIRNGVVEAMWEDVDQKSRRLGDAAASVRRKQISQLVDEFQAAIFSLDEGLGSSDVVLAGALWRIFFARREDVDPAHLNALVRYVRRHIHQLDQLTKEQLLEKNSVTWTAPEIP